MTPAVSVITVCRNALPDLQKTRESVEEQDYRNFEWIVIDGASTDGTPEMLEKIQKDNYQWRSEPDNGLYDAMNKGLHLATGHRIWFVNAGDRFPDSHTVAKVASVPLDIDVCYGEVVFEDSQGTVLGTRSELTPHPLPETLTKSGFDKGMLVSHQAFVPLRRLAGEYDAKRYKLSADYDWILKVLDLHHTSSNLGVLAHIQREGLSMTFWKRSKFERFLILSRHFGWRHTSVQHLLILWRGFRHALKGGLWR